MRKHGYGYLEEIVVRRADNVLYKLKEGDFLRLRINDIEDMLILVVQNWLTNLLGDDVANFAIALRMFTRSLLTRLLSSSMTFPKNVAWSTCWKRRWSNWKRKGYFIVQDINNLAKGKEDEVEFREIYWRRNSTELTQTDAKNNIDLDIVIISKVISYIIKLVEFVYIGMETLWLK
ncbi:hypothetical protein Tco_0009343 [Tanacetum coccineum]